MPLMAKTAQGHRPWVECGYSLVSLNGDKLGPECGIPVKKSLRTDFLYFLDIKWLITNQSDLLLSNVRSRPNKGWPIVTRCT